MKLWFLFLALVFLGSPTSNAQWNVTNLERVAGSEDRIEYRRYSLGEEKSGDDTEIQLALFSTKRATLRVIDEPELNRSLADVMKSENFLAGVNGGYFDPEGAPVGLLRSGGKAIAPFRRAKLLSGVLLAKPGRVRLLRASEFSSKSQWPEALQCGPFLVDHGKPVAGLNDTRRARRTFVLLTTDQRAAIGSSGSLTLAQLAEVVAALGDLKIDRALNLDGGSSSAFWCRTDQRTVSLPGIKSVRDFVVVAPR